MIAYLKTENRILRSKLPERVSVTTAERARLVRIGRRVGPAIRELIAIVHPQTFYRWLQANSAAKTKRRRMGRPPKPEALRELVVRMVKEDAWGKKRIVGELKKLGVRGRGGLPSTARGIAESL